MNERHKLFADTYISNGMNGVKAYMSVYPDATYDSARALATELLANINIKQYIAEQTKPIHEKLGITVEYVLSGLKNIVDDPSSPIGEKRRALETLGKIKNVSIFENNVNINANIKSENPFIELENEIKNKTE